jgi:hypothetical protein
MQEKNLKHKPRERQYRELLYRRMEAMACIFERVMVRVSM